MTDARKPGKSMADRIAEVMDEQELAIWNAAYAAAFVEGFGFYRRGAGSFEAAVAASADAGEAAHVADLAVMRLREWRRSECADTGLSIDLDKHEGE